MSALIEVLAAIDPTLQSQASVGPGTDRFADAIADPQRAFTIEAVYEGYLLHYGESRVFSGMDPDMCLLAGDALYALGLSRVAAVGDLEAVTELAELITATARANAEGDAARAEALWSDSAARLA